MKKHLNNKSKMHSKLWPKNIIPILIKEHRISLNQLTRLIKYYHQQLPRKIMIRVGHRTLKHRLTKIKVISIKDISINSTSNIIIDRILDIVRGGNGHRKI